MNHPETKSMLRAALPRLEFPQFEKVFEPATAEPFLRRVEHTRKQLNEVAMHSGNPAEKERAAAAFAAYTRALALVNEVAELRTKMAEEATLEQANR